MQKSPALRFGLRPLLAACLLFGLTFAVHGAEGQGTVGHAGITANNAFAPSPTTFATGMSADTVFVIPFAINYPEGESYIVNAVNLFLRDGALGMAAGSDSGAAPNTSGGGGDPGSGGGTPGGDGDVPPPPLFSGVSINIFSTLPTSLSLPTSLLDFSSLSGDVSRTPYSHHFSASSTAIFAAGVTYYLALSYSGPGNMEWVKMTSDSYGHTFPGDMPITSLVGDSDPLVFYKVTAGGVEGFYDNVGGFSIAANVISAIPEPATVGAVAASGVLALALFVRWRRRRAAASAEAAPSASSR